MAWSLPSPPQGESALVGHLKSELHTLQLNLDHIQLEMEILKEDNQDLQRDKAGLKYLNENLIKEIEKLRDKRHSPLPIAITRQSKELRRRQSQVERALKEAEIQPTQEHVIEARNVFIRLKQQWQREIESVQKGCTAATYAPDEVEQAKSQAREEVKQARRAAQQARDQATRDINRAMNEAQQAKTQVDEATEAIRQANKKVIRILEQNQQDKELANRTITKLRKKKHELKYAKEQARKEGKTKRASEDFEQKIDDLKRVMRLQEPLVECAVKIRRRFLEYTKAHLGDERASHKTITMTNAVAHHGDYVTDRAMAQLGYVAAAGSIPKSSTYESCIPPVSRDLLARLYPLPEHFLDGQDLFSANFIVCVNAVATMRSQNRHLTKNNNPIEEAARFESLYEEYNQMYNKILESPSVRDLSEAECCELIDDFPALNNKAKEMERLARDVSLKCRNLRVTIK